MVQRELTTASSPFPTTSHAADDQYITLDKDRCVECGLCVSICETGVYAFDDDWTFSFSPELCVECNLCVDVCPQKAILLRS
ncbi:MAG: ATP-binding protein [Candidatus Thorarchaeota archaeon]